MSPGKTDVRILLDTAALIYAVESPERLSPRVNELLQNPQTGLELSVVSLAEIAIKANLGKLKFPAELARMAIADLGIRLMPYTSEHAFRLFDLPLHHRDPFDRQIISQALAEKIAVVTPDEKFSLYRGLKVIW